MPLKLTPGVSIGVGRQGIVVDRGGSVGVGDGSVVDHGGGVLDGLKGAGGGGDSLLAGVKVLHELGLGGSHLGGVSQVGLGGSNIGGVGLREDSAENIWLVFWLKRPLEFSLYIPYTKKTFKN